MDELTISNDLSVVEAEISSFKQIAGHAVFEIGRRLKYVRDNDLTHGQWDAWCTERLNMSRREANRYVRVYDRFGNGTSMSQFGIAALDLLADLTDEQIEQHHTIPSTGESKTVDEMTVRELREVRKSLQEALRERDAAQQAMETYAQQATDLASENKKLRLEGQKIEYKEVPPNDYVLIKQQNEELKLKNESLNAELKVMKQPLLENAFAIKKRKQDLNQEARALASKVEVFIKEIAPLGYLSRLIVDADPEVRQEYDEALSILERWIFDVRQNIKQTSSSRSTEVIDTNYTEVEVG